MLSHSFNLISKGIRFHRSLIIKDVLYNILDNRESSCNNVACRTSTSLLAPIKVARRVLLSGRMNPFELVHGPWKCECSTHEAITKWFKKMSKEKWLVDVCAGGGLLPQGRGR